MDNPQCDGVKMHPWKKKLGLDEVIKVRHHHGSSALEGRDIKSLTIFLIPDI